MLFLVRRAASAVKWSGISLWGGPQIESRTGQQCSGEPRLRYASTYAFKVDLRNAINFMALIASACSPFWAL